MPALYPINPTETEAYDSAEQRGYNRGLQMTLDHLRDEIDHEHELREATASYFGNLAGLIRAAKQLAKE